MTATISLVGNVGTAELKYTPTGRAVLNLSIAVNRRRYNKERGEWEDAGTDWHRAALWGEKAEAAAESIVKGARVIVTGSLESRTYDKDGETRTAWEIKADEVGLVARAVKRERTDAAPAADPWAAGGEGPAW